MHSRYRLALGIVICLLSAGISHGMYKGHEQKGQKKRAKNGQVTARRKTNTGLEKIDCTVILVDPNKKSDQKPEEISLSNLRTNSTITDLVNHSKVTNHRLIKQQNFAVYQVVGNNKTYHLNDHKTPKILLSTLLVNSTPIELSIKKTK